MEPRKRCYGDNTTPSSCLAFLKKSLRHSSFLKLYLAYVGDFVDFGRYWEYLGISLEKLGVRGCFGLVVFREKKSEDPY